VSQASYAQPKERSQIWPKEKTKERKKRSKRKKGRKRENNTGVYI
jgi:hypothetical protein